MANRREEYGIESSEPGQEQRVGVARETVYRRDSPDEIERALATIGNLAHPPDDRYYERVLKGYSNLRKFLPRLLEEIPFDGTLGGKRILGALTALKKLERRRRVTRLEAGDPAFAVSTSWRPHVFPGPGLVDRHALTFALVEELREALHRRDVFEALCRASARWSGHRQRYCRRSGTAARRDAP